MRAGATLRSMLCGGQLSLLGHDEPEIDTSFAGLSRIELGRGAWFDYAQAWLRGDAVVFEHLLHEMHWRSVEERVYDKLVLAPRLYAALPDDGPGHLLLGPIRDALSHRYGEDFCRVSMALYRDGRDSVAWHGDRVARRMDSALVATISVGAPRRFLLRPYGGGRSIALRLGGGDLLVMGGSCQRTFQHSIPKVARADPRIAIMFRPLWNEDAAGAKTDDSYGRAPPT
jgi:alkylated DNA repair dioxygenase AlkB